MTQSDQSETPRCARCGQVVEVSGTGRILPHRDEVVRANCPAGGMYTWEATDWVRRARERLEALK